MPVVDFRPFTKQQLAWDYLHDETTNIVGYGGAARGGKSELGCAWTIMDSLMIPDSVTLMCREELKRLKVTTLVTFFRLIKKWGLYSRVTYNDQKSTILFNDTNSVIYLLELAYRPSDPEYEFIGSYDATRIFIDETSRVPKKAFDVSQARLSHLIGEYYHHQAPDGSYVKKKIIPKTYCSMNPNKGWNYAYFYKPWKANELPEDIKFIQALPSDNPYNAKEYIDNLAKRDHVTVERLLHGNWEYDDSKDRLMDYEKILDLFTNEYVGGGTKYITADIARKGSDKAVILVWDGWRIINSSVMSFSLTTDIEQQIKKFCGIYEIPMSDVIVDEDGVGGGVKDHLLCKGFINGSRPKRRENYLNLKSQSWFKFAEKVNKGEIYIGGCKKLLRYKDEIIADLEAIRQKNIDKDGKLQVIGKDEIKENIGRSPDFGDALMMRMAFIWNRELVIV